MLILLITFYLFIGMCITPACIFMEEYFFPTFYRNKSVSMWVLSILLYFVLWPLCLIVYGIKVLMSKFF